MPKLDFTDSQYEGETKDNKKEGKGTIKFKDGSSYEGEFTDDHFSKGTLQIFKDGKLKFTYVGFFNENNEIHGYGECTFESGEVYKGMYKNNKKDGPGLVTLKDKSTLKVNFKKGVPNGKAIYKQDGVVDRKIKEIFFDSEGQRQWTKREILRKQCTKEHFLKINGSGRYNICNVCRTSGGGSSIYDEGFWRCSDCDFDRCIKCYDEYKI